MSSGCGDVLSLADLQTAKKHQIFEAEVITGKSGGVAGGADIDYATNAVTGQTQKTLPAVLRDLGFEPASFDFTTGGTLSSEDRNKAVLWPLSSGGDGAYYTWQGTLPKTIPASSTPSSSGGVGTGAWKALGDITLGGRLAGSDLGEGDALVAVKQPVADSVLRTQHDKNTDSYSVKDFGAVGDGAVDDTVAVQKALTWLSGGPNRTLHIPQGLFAVSALSVTFSGLSATNCRVVSEGAFKHLSSSGDMITVSGATYSSFEFNIIGNGYNELTIPNYQTADPAGAQQAIVFAGNRACKLKIRAVGYPGRVLRVKASGSVKQSFIDLDITTGNDTCGQAMYLQGTDAWGCISFAQTNWDYYGSVLDNITDVSVVYWEAGCKNRSAPVINFNSVVNSHVTTVAAGGAKMLINGGSGITIQKALLGESLDYAMEVIGAGEGQPKHQLTVHSMLAANTPTAAVRLSNAVGVTFNDYLFDGAGYGFMFYNLCRDIQINGHNRNSATAAFFGAESSTLENITIRGKFYTAGSSTFCDFTNSATANVWLIDTTAVTTGFYLRLKDNSNGVNVRGGNWSGTTFPMTSAINNTPRTIRDVTGISTRVTARALTIPSGSASGATVSLAHGLYKAPNEIFITVTDIANNVSAGSSTVLVRSIDSTNIVFKYSGAAALANALGFTITAKCEERSN